MNPVLGYPEKLFQRTGEAEAKSRSIAPDYDRSGWRRYNTCSRVINNVESALSCLLKFYRLEQEDENPAGDDIR